MKKLCALCEIFALFVLKKRLHYIFMFWKQIGIYAIFTGKMILSIKPHSMCFFTYFSLKAESCSKIPFFLQSEINLQISYH